MPNKKVVILFNKISEQPTLDEEDVLYQVDEVHKSLIELGYEPFQVPFSIEIKDALDKIKSIAPLFIFNLVESIDGKNELISLAPLLLNHIDIPYTGSPLEAIFLTTNKLWSKKIMRHMQVNTPDWFQLNQLNLLDKEKKYIVKPITEDGSVKLHQESVFSANDIQYFEGLKKMNSKEYFIEEYLDGREFNVVVFGTASEPLVLPPSEILFENYPEGKAKILCYRSKWIEDSFEYENTNRTFNFEPQEEELLNQMKEMSIKCWHEFGLNGYCRMDIRTDSQNIPYIIEINANPCITPMSGILTTAEKAGYEYVDVIKMIIDSTFND